MKLKNVLNRLLDITLFLAKQNLPFRGHSENESSSNKGNFLELIDVLSKYDRVLNEHIQNLEDKRKRTDRTVSYLSPQIQNEFIGLISNHVKHMLVDEIKAAKYYGMMFDSTPDISHADQMSQVIRYVKIHNRTVEVKEVFLGFFPLKGKKAIDLSNEILAKLESDGLDIMMCRSQGYDNAATMSVLHGGGQAIIKTQNDKAIFSGCIDHTLNLCGQHSFAENASCTTFFGSVEAVYAFFSASTSRWDVLLKHTNASLKRLITTRWSAHYAAVKVMTKNFDAVIAAVQELCDRKENLETRCGAQNLLPSMCNFVFLCYLFFWNHILKEVDDTQVYLQTKGLSLDKVLIKMEALRVYILENRLSVVNSSIESALQKCIEYDICTQRRQRFKKRMPGENARDEGLNLKESTKQDMLQCLDRFHTEISTRLTGMRDVFSIFQAVTPESLLSNPENMKERLKKLCSVYDEICEEELEVEVKRLKRHMRAAQVENREAKEWPY